MRPKLLSDLADVGYEVFLDGDNIRYRYRKPGEPPDVVRPLIDELRNYKAEVVEILKTGNTINPTRLYPYPKGTSETHLEQAMLAIWEPVFDRIKTIWPMGFLGTAEICAAEREIERCQALILSGTGEFASYRRAVEAWEQAVKRGVAQ